MSLWSNTWGAVVVCELCLESTPFEAWTGSSPLVQFHWLNLPSWVVECVRLPLPCIPLDCYFPFWLAVVITTGCRKGASPNDYMSLLSYTLQYFVKVFEVLLPIVVQLCHASLIRCAIYGATIQWLPGQRIGCTFKHGCIQTRSHGKCGPSHKNFWT